jgi:hypothetical protein
MCIKYSVLFMSIRILILLNNFTNEYVVFPQLIIIFSVELFKFS